MKISLGGLGAPLVSVLGDVITGLARDGVVETTYADLIEAVRKTDRFTGRKGGDRFGRLHEPVGPERSSIRRVLRQKAAEGVLTFEYRRGRERQVIIAMRRPWGNRSGDWFDEHDPTCCQCGANFDCPKHNPENFRRLVRRICG